MTNALLRKLYLLIILLGLNTQSILAQNPVKLDSLLNRLKTATPDTSKVNLLRKIAKSITVDDKKLAYTKDELALATNLNWAKGRAKALSDLGLLSLRRNDYTGAAANYQQAYDVAKAAHEPALMYNAALYLGLADRLSGNFPAAFKYLSEDFEYEISMPDKKIPGHSLYFGWHFPAWQLGMLYHQQKNDAKALNFYHELIEKFKKQKNNEATLAAQVLIPDYKFEMANDYPAAIGDYRSLLKEYKANDTSENHTWILEALSECCLYISKYETALNYRKEYCDLFYRNDKLAAQKNIGKFTSEIYAEMDDYKEALIFDLNEYNQISKHESFLGQSWFYCDNVAKDYLHLKQYDKALYYSLKAVDVTTRSKDDWNKAYAEVTLATIYDALKDYKNVFKTVAQGMAIRRQALDNQYSYDYLLGLFCKNAPDSLLEQNNIPITNRYVQAAKYLRTTLTGALKENDVTLQRDCLKALSDIYEKQHDYQLFYENYKPYIALKDSLDNHHDQSLIRQQELQVQFIKRTDSLKYQQKLAAQKARQQTYYYLGGLAFLLILSFFITRNYINQRKANKLISAAKQRSDELLLNILPADVAEELKEKGSANARLFDEVTVLFTDFVNFTTTSELLNPQELVNELHYCFKGFDGIITKYNIEKIKTIGDAYLAVAGLPNANKSHAAEIIMAAIEIQHFMVERKKAMGSRSFDIRIGIHSGSVVAGIVGVKKFAYDIWGDTVNTAARMEQNSQSGKINVSEKTYDLVKNQFEFTYRGEIEAKNKGLLKMFYIEPPAVKISKL